MKKQKIGDSFKSRYFVILFSSIFILIAVAICWAVVPPPYAKFEALTDKKVMKANIKKIKFVEFQASEENNGKKIRYSGRIQVDNYEGDIGKYLQNNNLRLIPVVFYGAYYTYFERPVKPDGSFKGTWPIKSTQDRDFWVALFKTDSIVKPAQEPTAPDTLPEEMFAASSIETF